jgi:putative selenium metabolism hydrolase
MARIFRELGYDEVATDDYGNVIGRIHGSRPGARVLLDGHLDTVPVDDPTRWEHDPYGGLVLDDRVYGRGASDMKGAVAAMICAAAYYADSCSRDFPGEIYVAGVVQEELFEGVAARMISEFVRPDYVIIGEASELNLKVGQRGRAEIVLETEGRSVHSANPEKGVNAVTKMLHLLMVLALENLYPCEQKILGKGMQELTDIKSSPYPSASVIPDRCVTTLDRRLLVGETRESVLLPIRSAINRIRREDSDFKGGRLYSAKKRKACYTEMRFPRSVFSRAGCSMSRRHTSKRVQRTERSGAEPPNCDLLLLYQWKPLCREKGIRTIGFGPSQESLAHIVDE